MRVTEQDVHNTVHDGTRRYKTCTIGGVYTQFYIRSYPREAHSLSTLPQDARVLPLSGQRKHQLSHKSHTNLTIYQDRRNAQHAATSTTYQHQGLSADPLSCVDWVGSVQRQVRGRTDHARGRCVVHRGGLKQVLGLHERPMGHAARHAARLRCRARPRQPHREGERAQAHPRPSAPSRLHHLSQLDERDVQRGPRLHQGGVLTLATYNPNPVTAVVTVCPCPVSLTSYLQIIRDNSSPPTVWRASSESIQSVKAECFKRSDSSDHESASNRCLILEDLISSSVYSLSS
jgi:hypothetical protein